MRYHVEKRHVNERRVNKTRLVLLKTRRCLLHVEDIGAYVGGDLRMQVSSGAPTHVEDTGAPRRHLHSQVSSTCRRHL